MFTERDFRVTLTNSEDVPGFIKRHGEFACVCYNTPKDGAEKVGLHCMDSGHFSGSRHLYFTFELESIPRFTIDQLVRHEVGVVKNVQSLRYVNKDDTFSVYCPPEKLRDVESRWEHQRAEDYLSICYRHTIRQIKNEVGVERANEIARTFVPMGIESKCSFACNLEGLINLSHKRLCMRAELPIRHLVSLMVEEVIKVEPRYEKLLVPQCEYMGKCVENKSCGRYEREE